MLRCYNILDWHQSPALSDLSLCSTGVYTLPNSNHWEWSSAKITCKWDTCSETVPKMGFLSNQFLSSFTSMEHLLHCSTLICRVKSNINCVLLYERPYFESIVDLLEHCSKCSDGDEWRT